jgi:lipopolysaccharide/colanic/teichoic acid biosynthesis glycosyltransferase
MTSRELGRASIPYRVTRDRAGYRFVKRLIDLSLGAVLFVVSLPILLIAALAIWIETPGSPIFIQKRMGLHGRPFRIIKLRGMYRDARERFPELYDYSQQTGLNFHFHNQEDPRVTRVGRLTRRTSIDELPNFLNVLLGDMSLVGPRPEIPDVLDLYGIYRGEYLSVKPGITCLSKCTGRDSLTKQESVEMDIQYIRTRGFRTDAKILWRTFCGVVLRKNVY